MKLALACLLSLPTALPSDDCAACKPNRTCAPHKAQERATIADLRGDLSGRSFTRRKRALTAVAELNKAHANAPSRPVTRVLVDALDDELEPVRRHAARLLGRYQHPEMATRALASALGRVGSSYEVLGSRFAERARRAGATEALKEGLSVRDVRGALIRFEARENLRAVSLRLPDSLVFPPMPPLNPTPEAKREYEKKKREYEKKKKEAKKKEAADEREAKKADKRAKDAKALLDEVDAALDSFELAPALLASLGNLPGAASDAAVRLYFQGALSRCPSHAVEAASVLVGWGDAKSVETVVASLSRSKRKVEERIGAADVSHRKTRDWARAVHDLLAELAAERGLSRPAEWNEHGPDAWAEWFTANEAQLGGEPQH